MGGRGSSSPGGSVYLPAEVLESLPYNITAFDDDLGGSVYPFLEQTGRAWRILTRPVAEAGETHPAHTFNLDRPTLRWVNGDQVSDLYVDGMTTEQFLEATGLKLDMHKGGFVLSKRISRLMRPHFMSGFFRPEEVPIAYMEQTPQEAKVWDGAGLISRRMLRRMVLSEKLSPARRERLETELRHTGRVEFTVMTARGQDKGHAMVADDLRDADGRSVDFLLPQDTKKEVRLESGPTPGGGPTFVGLSFVHGHNDMRLDIQSLINLHPFFEEEQLLDWLKDEGELFVQSVESGQVAEVMGRIDKHTTMDELQAWPLREYLASGGQPLWFRSHVKGLLNQHLKRLNHATLAKMRLPIPGGRHYVMPAGVGQRAGMKGLAVPRGHIHIDDKRGTAWVNDEDWLALPDSPRGEGIASILGGADNDDALWLHPFTDHPSTSLGTGSGEQKVLAWRSPNQVGEYVVLRPTADSTPLSWARADGEAAAFPPADSRRLPPRVDFTDPDYLGLVDAETAGGLGEGEAYNVEVMEAAVSRAVANQGALGMYCNSLMVNKALFGGLPARPPAPLEDIIDSAVKTGADLSQVVEWNYENSRQILESGRSIPALLHGRLSIDRAERDHRPPAPRASGVAGRTKHWLDRLEAGIRGHIQAMQAARDELAGQARPPAAFFERVSADSPAVRLGAGLNQTYAAALQLERRGASGEGSNFSSALERAKLAVEDYLAHFPPEKRGEILLGALRSVYGEDNGGADSATSTGSVQAVWLAGVKEEVGWERPGLGWGSVGQLTVEALRGIGLLDEIVLTKEGLVVYPVGMEVEG